MWSNVAIFSYLEIEPLRLDLSSLSQAEIHKKKKNLRNPETQQSNQREKESRDSEPCWTDLILDHQPEIIWVSHWTMRRRPRPCTAWVARDLARCLGFSDVLGSSLFVSIFFFFFFSSSLGSSLICYGFFSIFIRVVNRVLETRFPCGRHIGPHQTMEIKSQRLDL